MNVIPFCLDPLLSPRERGECERTQLELEQTVRDKERRVLEGRRKAIEEKRKLLETQAGAVDLPFLDGKEAGASVVGGGASAERETTRLIIRIMMTNLIIIIIIQLGSLEPLAFCLLQEMATPTHTPLTEVRGRVRE